MLKVSADPLRLRTLTMLAAEQLCVCHLQDALGAGQTLVSHHLRVLRDAGLVETEPAGRFTYYRLRPDSFQEASQALAALADASRTPPPKRPCLPPGRATSRTLPTP